MKRIREKLDSNRRRLYQIETFLEYYKMRLRHTAPYEGFGTPIVIIEKDGSKTVGRLIE